MVRDLAFEQTLDIRFVAVLLVTAVTVLLSVIILIFKESIPKIIYFLLRNFISPELGDTAQSLIDPYKVLIQIIITLVIAEIIIALIPFTNNYPLIEIITSLGLTLTISWLISRISSKFLDNYLLDLAAKNGRKANSELFISAKVVSNLSIIIIAIIIFAQTHQINVFGLFASLGIGGLAVAFAAQKTLEQFLGGVVIYLDQPFTIDDYIGLPDGIFGRVESIGWRSTKIRTSGRSI